MTRRPILLISGLAIVALLVVWKVLPGGAGSELADQGPPQADRLQVEVQTLKGERLVQLLSTTGTLRANERVEVVSEIGGKVERILFEEGRRVRRGELLVKIDDSELQARRERTLNQLELARLREQRQRELLDQGVTSRQEYDFAASELAVLEAELRLVEAQLEKTEIRAPFDGLVGLRRVSEGTYLSSQTRITTLQDMDPVKLDFTVPEQYAGRIEIGGEVDFRVKGSDDPIRGTIYAVEPSVDPETRSLLVRATSPNPERSLVPGAFADVEVVIGEKEDALVVPAIAVIPELGGKKVYLLEEGEAHSRPVRTGIRTGERIEILAGVEAGERVIVSGIPRLRPGLPVEAVEAAAP